MSARKILNEIGRVLSGPNFIPAVRAYYGWVNKNKFISNNKKHFSSNPLTSINLFDRHMNSLNVGNIRNIVSGNWKRYSIIGF